MSKQYSARQLARLSSSSTRLALPRAAQRSLVVPAAQNAHQQYSGFPRSVAIGAAAAGSILAGLAWSNNAQAEEQPVAQGPIFSHKDVEVFAVIGPPLCGKATMCQRMARRFDMMNLGPEDDFFTEISSHMVAARGQKLRVVLNGFPKNLEEAKWFEEEICKISAIVYVDCPPEVAEKRTQQRARKAVQGGHKLFQRSTETLIAQFREQGNFLEIAAERPLEDAWKMVEAKVESAMELSERGELI